MVTTDGGGQKSVWVAGRGGVAERRDVTLAEAGDEALVASGLQVGDELIVDAPPRSVAHDGPTYERPATRPAYLDALQADGPQGLARPATGDELQATLLRLIASPNLCDKSWVTDQYDRYVMGNTALAQPDDAGVVRVDEETGRGVAISTDCNSRFAKLDPYTGAQLALAEAYRNVATAGAVRFGLWCYERRLPPAAVPAPPGGTGLARITTRQAVQASAGAAHSKRGRQRK